MKCPSEMPLYNKQSNICESCAEGLIWSDKYQSCVKECNEEEEWSPEYKKCLKKDRECPVKQIFSIEANKCTDINCTESQPFWNMTANECQSCPSGTVYNFNSNSCENDNRSGNISVCHQNKPLWNPQYLRCQACPEGQ